MITPNFLVLALSALVPLVIGFVWYNPKVFGNAWMKATGMTEEKAKGANMPLIFGLTFLFSFFIAFVLQTMVIHQFAFSSMMMGEPGVMEGTGAAHDEFMNIMNKYGTRFRSFKHGVLHGAIAGIFLALPIVAVNALFERKGWKYIWINAGYWIVSMALMGGVICQFT